MNSANDAFQSAQGAKMPTILCVLCNIGILAIPAYFFGTYWLNNPDMIQEDGTNLYCWAPNTALAANVTNYEILGANATATAGYLNVTQGFLVWFEWGFLFLVIQATAMLCMIAALFCTPFGIAGGFSCCCVSCGQFVWFIVGMVLRWRAAGVICSGGNQMVNADPVLSADAAVGKFAPGVLQSSGQFLKVWIIINLSMMGCSCCLSITGWIIALVKGA